MKNEKHALEKKNLGYKKESAESKLSFEGVL
jgi:hypothetical protein